MVTPIRPSQVKEMGFRPNEKPADYATVHRALLSGLLGQVAFKQEQEEDAVLAAMRAIMHKDGLKPADKVILIQVADLVGGKVGQPVSVSKAELARLAGMPRRTLFDRLPRLASQGLLRADGALCLTEAAVREPH